MYVPALWQPHLHRQPPSTGGAAACDPAFPIFSRDFQGRIHFVLHHTAPAAPAGVCYNTCRNETWPNPSPNPIPSEHLPRSIPPSLPLSGMPTRKGSRTLGLQPRRPRAEAPSVQICASCTAKHMNCNVPDEWATCSPCTNKPSIAVVEGETAGAGLGPRQQRHPGGVSCDDSFRECLRRAGGPYRRRCSHTLRPRHSRGPFLHLCLTGDCGSVGSDDCGPVIPLTVSLPDLPPAQLVLVVVEPAVPISSILGRLEAVSSLDAA